MALILSLLLLGSGTVSLPLYGAGDPLPRPAAVGAAAGITTWPKNQLRPRVAYSAGADEYMVVWEHVHSDTDDDVYARRVRDDGVPLSSEIAIVSSTSVENHPNVAAGTSNSEYLVVWEYEYSATDHDIYAQRVTTTGTLVGSKFGVATTGYWESYPAVAYNVTVNEYLVVYQHLTGSDEFAQYDIYAQRLSATGGILGAPIVVASTSLEEVYPAVAFGSDYLIVWQAKQAPAATEYGIYGQRVASNGVLTGGRINLSTWEGDQILPRVAHNDYDDEFLVVWEDHHYGAANGWDIYGQLVNADSSLQGGHLAISGGDTKDRLNPDVAYSPLNRSYLVAWEYELVARDHDVYTRRVAYDGTRPEAEAVLSNLGTHEMRPVVAAGSDAEQALFAAWEDYRNLSTQGIDLYGSLVTMAVPTLSGYVYSGTAKTGTDPIAGATVRLYCSGSAGELGDQVGSTVTIRGGQYELPAYGQCEYYHIVEVDPEGYVSLSSETTGGTIVNSNWLRYQHPLVGKVLTGNNFWDYPEGPGDSLPPGNWTGFSPAGWTNDQTSNCSVQVEDTVSGLNVETAQYAYSTTGGEAWSEWERASCTGSSGTTAPQTLSAAVPFGQDSGPSDLNRVKFRIADVAGNDGTSGVYVVGIDTVAPANPTSITCLDHPAYLWTNVSQVTCQWSGASDDRSGVDGYTLDWDHVPSTVPALPVETSSTEATVPLGDSTSWYLHVRSVDEAGNGASGAAHYGPILIDTLLPSAWLTAPSNGAQDTPTFNVSWTGTDSPSGIASYDVQNSLDGSTWSNWHTGVTYKTASFTGQRGSTYYFRVRATDVAGNVSDWSSPRSMAIGVAVTVRVEDEASTPLDGAEVYLNGIGVGSTYSGGTLTVYNVMLNDQLAARYAVDHHGANKGSHNWVYASSGNWSYRTYQTSVDFDNAGNPQMHTVSNTGTPQVLEVRHDNALVGFYVLVSVQWDASAAFLNELLTGFRNASEYLYDLTDGQMFFHVVDIRDNKQGWDVADYRIHASNQEWPHASVGGIWKGTDKHVYMGRYFDGWGSNQGPWDQPDAFRTLIHEFGHYGLDLRDEYLNADGGKDGQGCTTDRGTTPAAEQACFMDHQYTATEICSQLPLHPHNTNTHQHGVRGEPCWDTINRRYDDEGSPMRWWLERPPNRGSVMPGPNALAVDDWMFAAVRMDDDTPVCPPFSTDWQNSDGSMAVDFDTWVEGGPTIYQGKTVANATSTAGTITILGAYHGNTVRVRKSCGIWCSHSGTTTAHCPTGAVTAAAAPVTLSKDPFGLDVRARPLADGETIEVTVQASTALDGPPQVEVWQAGAADPIDVVPTYNGTAYVGTAALDPALGLRGEVWAQATDTAARAVTVLVAFNAERASASELTWLQSDDGRMDLFLPAGSLPGEPVVGILPAGQVPLVQGELSVVGSPYKVSLSGGSGDLDLPATINIRYRPDLAAAFDPRTMRIHHWDPQAEQWVSEGGAVDLANYFVSAQVDHLSTFAVLGEKASLVYLPIVTRRR